MCQRRPERHPTAGGVCRMVAPELRAPRVVGVRSLGDSGLRRSRELGVGLVAASTAALASHRSLPSEPFARARTA
jgi:hypothetical protein